MNPAAFRWLVIMSAAMIPIAIAEASPRASSRWHPSEKRYPFQGIDVSHHQGRIAWERLPRQGVDFAYIKATEGADHADRRFSINWREADAAGIHRGAYHFFTLCRSGRDQAAHFVRHVPVDAGALPPAVDLEFPGNCKRRPSRAKFHRELGDFLQIVEARYGRHAVLYLTPHFDKRYRVSATFKRPLWLRSIRSKPRFGARQWTIWQASTTRRLKGVRGRVDWNVARKHALL
ncbi:GH25 family lysozyme [Sphingomonas hankyongi]|uniref:Lysozyme n=1 Tax=Sphingomonas hankyongi TaxID=2908209 RepID=A0ABT0RYR6_9SPHN|nr:GH25 family lysozyme [Sphingomonas hankyongi]MCL6728533.1 lysozyme [Sphingomonas hankyongi]